LVGQLNYSGGGVVIWMKVSLDLRGFSFLKGPRTSMKNVSFWLQKTHFVSIGSLILDVKICTRLNFGRNFAS
jgi:hypothetical protein